MSSLDIILLQDKCPDCGLPLRADYTPSGYDEDGHAHEVDLDGISCPGCGYSVTDSESNPARSAFNSKVWERARELIYQVHSDPNIITLGGIYQEFEFPLCPECRGKTILFRGKGIETHYYLCSRYQEKGHLSEAEVREKLRKVIAMALPSGRWA